MTVHVVRIEERGSKYVAPLMLVQCGFCGDRYRTRAYISDVIRRKSCHECASRFQRLGVYR